MPIRLARTTLPVPAYESISPVRLPEMVLSEIVLSDAPNPRTTPRNNVPLPRPTVPVASRPTRLPTTWLLPPTIWTPSWLLPDTTLRAAAVVQNGKALL